MMDNQFVRFVIVGIVNTLFYFSIYSIFLFFTNNMRLSVLIATIIGILFSFRTLGVYVFNNENKSLIFKFFIVYGLLYIVNINFIIMIDIVTNNLYSAGFISSIFMAVLTFYVNKYLVFKKIKKEING